MKHHRVRSADPINEKSERHLFLEMSPDYWLEVRKPVSHKAIHSFLRAEKKNECFHMGFATQSFNIGIIKNWKEEKPI